MRITIGIRANLNPSFAPGRSSVTCLPCTHNQSIVRTCTWGHYTRCRPISETSGASTSTTSQPNNSQHIIRYHQCTKNEHQPNTQLSPSIGCTHHVKESTNTDTGTQGRSDVRANRLVIQHVCDLVLQGSKQPTNAYQGSLAPRVTCIRGSQTQGKLVGRRRVGVNGKRKPTGEGKEQG